MDKKTEFFEQLAHLLAKHGIEMTNALQEDVKSIFSEYNIARKENQKRPNLKKRIEHFLAVKKVDGLSEKTLSNYRINLGVFARQVEKNVAQITTDDIREYMVYLTTQRKLKDSSLVTHVNTLRSFFSWMFTEGLIKSNPMLKIKSKKLDKRGSRHGLTLEEMEKLRDACKTYREKAIVEIYYSTGCRLSEIANATMDDVNLQERTIQVKGKGGKFRTVYFSSRAKYMLSEYLKESHKGHYLFCSARKPYNGLGIRTIQQIIRQLGERANISRQVHPHLLRHTFATDLVNAGVDITVIQTLLGHTDPSTTLIYAEMSPLTTRRQYDRAVA